MYLERKNELTQKVRTRYSYYFFLSGLVLGLLVALTIKMPIPVERASTILELTITLDSLMIGFSAVIFSLRQDRDFRILRQTMIVVTYWFLASIIISIVTISYLPASGVLETSASSFGLTIAVPFLFTTGHLLVGLSMFLFLVIDSLGFSEYQAKKEIESEALNL